MKRLLGFVFLAGGISVGALGAPPGPPAGNPIINGRAHQRNSEMNIDTATIRVSSITQFSNTPSLPNGLVINGALYNSSGTFVNVISPPLFFNVKDFGALGDGATDDAAAIQYAIDSVSAGYGGTLFFPRGTYVIRSTITISHSLRLVGVDSVENSDNSYLQDAGAPNGYTWGSIIYMTNTNTNAIRVTQNSAYRTQVEIENFLVLGPGQATGSSGSGIVVDTGTAGLGTMCRFRNVNIAIFRSYGLSLVDGYYGSTFDNISIFRCGLTGFHASGGSNQGEMLVTNLRVFQNGLMGQTQSDAGGIYSEAPGAYIRISATENQASQAYFKGANFNLVNFQSESFRNSVDKSTFTALTIERCVSAHVDGAYFSPGFDFHGKLISVSSSSNIQMDQLNFFTTVDNSGYHIFEDTNTTTSGNIYQISTNVTGTLRASLSPTSFAGVGSDLFFKGTVSTNNAPSGYFGEYLSSTTLIGSSVTFPASGTYGDILSIPVTPGDLNGTACISISPSTASVTAVDFGISNTPGNSSIGFNTGDNSVPLIIPSTGTWVRNGGCVSEVRIQPLISTTYYLKVKGTFSAGTPVVNGARFSFRRAGTH